jgi:hypothetical protein
MNLRSINIFIDTNIKNGKLKIYLFGFSEDSVLYYTIFVDIIDKIREDLEPPPTTHQKTDSENPKNLYHSNSENIPVAHQ